MEHLPESEDELVFQLEAIVKRGLFSSLPTSSLGRGQELLERFGLPIFTVRDAGITAKRFHGWHKAELLPFSLPEGKMNLLTFPEYIWVRLISRLRELGTPLQHIRLLKEFLYAQVSLASLLTPENMALPEARRLVEQGVEQLGLPPHLKEQVLERLLSGQYIDELEGQRMPVLEMLLLSLLTDLREAGVIMLPGHRFSLWAEGEARPDQTHLYLSITQEVLDFRMNTRLERKAEELRLPTPQERQVLDALRDQANRSVTVTFTDRGQERQMDLVTTRHENLDEETKAKIQELLRLQGYSEVTLKTSNGELVFSERSKRKRL